MPGRRTSTMELLAEAAADRGLPVRAAEDLATASGPEAHPAHPARPAHWYGGPIAGARLADRLGFALLEPTDDWLAELPSEFTGREIRSATVADARAIDRPTFVKPPREKSFPAAVYSHGSQLPADLDPATPVLLSEVVTFAAEYRLFLLDGEIATAGRYAAHGRLDPRPLTTEGPELQEFVTHLLATTGPTLPSAVVLDLGQLLHPYRPGHRWSVVEANMAWFSHAYTADPARVLDVVLRAAGPRDRVSPADLPFIRH
nr:ATP-grasp domain-containing protein [Kitasatospora sp. MMS16-BH015]